VVPVNCREQVLKFGHDFGAHISRKKNLQQIRLNFWWPNMKADAFDHAKHCETCQLHERKTCWDKVPIQAVQRSEVKSNQIKIKYGFNMGWQTAT